MSKAQKTIIVLTLLLMTLILMFPPIFDEDLLVAGREFIFVKKILLKIDVPQTIFELLAIAFLGGTIVALFDLKKKK